MKRKFRADRIEPFLSHSVLVVGLIKQNEENEMKRIEEVTKENKVVNKVTNPFYP